MLLRLCAENDLTITNTLFRPADKYKTTWIHSRSKQWHLIDYAIGRRRDIRDIRITRAMWGAECWTDHHLVRSILSLLNFDASQDCETLQASFLTLQN